MTLPPDHLALFAVPLGVTRGRIFPEEADASVSPFELDNDRIVNCTAFRRLMHKTQVFVAETGDHYRTRLTHTLEVAAYAQRLACRLLLNEQLAVNIALAHDLGHPPFGHAGEAALAELMAGQGGFEHNRQSLRVVDYLEHPYPMYRGLNLTFELRESLIKHCTLYDHPADWDSAEESLRPLLEVGVSPPLEGQIAALADSIAYTLHDIEDGLVEAGLSETMLQRCALWREAAEPVRRRWPNHSLYAVRRPILDRMAAMLVQDAVEETQRRLRTMGVDGPDAVRQHVEPLAAFSARVGGLLCEMHQSLREHLYRHHHVVRMDTKARRVIRELFEAFRAEPRLLPPRFLSRVSEQGASRVICDYLAGMTDRYCQMEHRRIFSTYPTS